MNAYVMALAVSGSDVYAGGVFTTAGGSAANYIAKWDGSSWSALGSGTGGGNQSVVFALAVSGSDLYAGGYFITAGAAGGQFPSQNGRGQFAGPAARAGRPPPPLFSLLSPTT